MTPRFLEDERVAALLVERTIDGLDEESSAELSRLSEKYPEYDDDAVDRVAAAVSLSDLRLEAVPDALRHRLESDAERWLGGGAGKAADVVDLAGRRRPPARRSGLQWLAAASVLIAAVGWYQAVENGMERDAMASRLGKAEASLEDQRQTVARLREAQAPDAGALRARLAGSAAAQRIEWAHTEDPAGANATGELVWDAEQQQGYMRFSGLAANDPGESQYQLWIFDANRDDRYPVDGGVFDVPADGGEIIVPIHAKLKIGQPVLFAITVERPGGVVVSDRERIALVARPDQEI